jgi:protein-tyrosine-phosphatase/DNA-binding transcriptional ArsR family regulator
MISQNLNAGIICASINAGARPPPDQAGQACEQEAVCWWLSALQGRGEKPGGEGTAPVLLRVSRLHQINLMYYQRVGSDSVHAAAPPPEFLRLAGHPLRWLLLSELARSDRRVHELVTIAGKAQNAVSYHLGQLRAGGLVSARRSSADRRDTYYRVELARCGQLLAAVGDALQPGLLPALPASPGVTRPRWQDAPVRVLFLCTGNSSRSQIAEALLQQAAGRQVNVVSAGSAPKPIHADAVKVMAEFGIDISGRRSKHLSEFRTHRFDYVITLCDRVRESCPEFPGGPEPIHWSIPDPAIAALYDDFQRTAADLQSRIGYLIQRITRVERSQHHAITAQ